LAHISSSETVDGLCESCVFSLYAYITFFGYKLSLPLLF
jgi:uncharacterized membrane protein (GlpM family)